MTSHSCHPLYLPLIAADSSANQHAVTRIIAAIVVNSLSLLGGCTKQTLDKLQRVLNCTVRVIFGGNSLHHVTPLLRDHLHWLRARECNSFKLCLLVYKAIHGLALCCRNELCIPVSTVPNLSALRSAARGDLIIPRTWLQLGNWAFCVAGLGSTKVFVLRQDIK